MTKIERTRESNEDSYTSMSYVMMLDGQEIGSACLTVDENNAYCERIDIDETHRNHGYGTEFLRAQARDGIQHRKIAGN